MRWALGGIALVVVANAIALVPARRERAEPAAFSTIALCPGQLVGGAGSDLAPAIRLVLAPDSGPPAPGLDAEGLRALGFTERVIAVIGQERPTGFHWPSPRPAWVRLRQAPEDSLRQFVAAEVRPRRELLVADSGSIVIRALVGLRQRMAAPAAPPTEGHDHGGAARPPVPALMSASVLELLPSQLHLDWAQVTALRALPGDSTACGGARRVRIANGAEGGIWVAGVATE
ncbi:MAG: hypothetical protein IPI38_17065 [Gemmatimonadetes bacterium]|nr:hypothetical protein [Gemmatimonadota bacterium]MBK7717101.1 hypothetical protein [Gemmatimonadota bacterium]